MCYTSWVLPHSSYTSTPAAFQHQVPVRDPGRWVNTGFDARPWCKYTSYRLVHRHTDWAKHWRYDLHFWWFYRVGQWQINDNINCAKGIPGVNLHLNLNQALTNPIYNQTQTYLNRITLGLLLRALPLVANYWGLPHRLLQCSLFTNPPFVHHRKYLQTRDKVLWCINSMKVDTIL